MPDHSLDAYMQYARMYSRFGTGESLTSGHVDWVRASDGEVSRGAFPARKAENGVFVY